MGSDSYKAWNDWMDSADNHVYSLFDIWEAGRDFQKQKDVDLCLALKYEAPKAGFFARVIKKQEDI